MGTAYRLVRAAVWIASLAAVAWLAADGLSYYLEPLVQRPRHPDYWELKPGGGRGHLLGIVGSSMMVVMLVYSVRRRWRPLRRAGPLRVWLDFHIWCGVVGPLLVVLHSSFKVTGLVALSFWSMVLVALSGALGRYLYVQIPRRRSGDALSLEEARERSDELAGRLREAGVGEEELGELDRRATAGLRPEHGLLALFLRLPWQGLALRFRMWRWRRDLARRASALVPRETLGRLGKAATERALLERRIQLWDRLHGLFHYWHVAHKPFAVVMYVFMVVHIAVAAMTGYAFGG